MSTIVVGNPGVVVRGTEVPVSGAGVAGRVFSVYRGSLRQNKPMIEHNNSRILEGMVTQVGRNAEFKRQADESRLFARVGVVTMVAFLGLFVLLAVNASLHGQIFNTSGLAPWLAPLIAGGIPSLLLGFVGGCSVAGARDLKKKLDNTTSDDLNLQVVRSICGRGYSCAARIQNAVIDICNFRRKEYDGQITYERGLIRQDLGALLDRICKHLGMEKESADGKAIKALLDDMYQEHCGGDPALST